MLLSFLCAFSSSLDSLAVSISYGSKKISLPISAIIIVSFVSTIGTFLAMKFGQIIIMHSGENVVSLIGSLILICLGVYFVYDSVITKDISIKELLDDPLIADYNKSGVIDANEAFFLASALTINNIGVGVASSIAGLDIILTTVFTFIITVLSLKIGYVIGERYFNNYLGNYAQVVSGLIIIGIGLFKIIWPI